ncbi:pof4 [Linum perenne]
MMGREGKRVAPSLVDLCVNVAIENVKYLGDVGETDSDLLGRILCHCTLEQLTHVEESTVYGERSTNLVLERMKLKKVSFQWKQLYEAKSKDVAEAENKAGARFREGYKNVDARKQRRQIKVCSKVPPSSNKRSWGGYDTGNSKSSIMKKSKIDFLKSREVKNITAMNKRAAQRRISSTSTPASRPPTIMRPTSSFTGRNPSAPLSSSARPPMQRRF